MLSRVAENIYWTARYLERAENIARLINVTSNLLLDLPNPKGVVFGWAPLIAINGCNEVFFERYSEPSERNVVKFLIAEATTSSILNALECARNNMRTTRDIIPVDGWEQVNDLYLFVKRKIANGIHKRNRYDFLKQVILGCQQVTGIATGTMSRDAAYNFLRLGSYLERTDMTTRILDVRSASLLPKVEDESIKLSPFANIQWMSVLKTLTAYQMYRQQVRLRVRGPDVLRFLLQDAKFPRAVLFCLNVVESCLSGLPKNDMPLRSLGRVQRQVQAAEVHKLAYRGLHEFTDELQIGMAAVHDQIAIAYFSVETSTTAA